jgi:putative sigma-54 modulation protein
MRLQLTVRHGQASDSVRRYVEAKFRKLERRLHEATLAEIVLDRERNPKIADDHVVEATLHVKGPNLHGRDAAPTFEAATDLLIDKLERQIERARDKKTLERRRRAQHDALASAPPEEAAPQAEESAA